MRFTNSNQFENLICVFTGKEASLCCLGRITTSTPITDPNKYVKRIYNENFIYVDPIETIDDRKNENSKKNHFPIARALVTPTRVIWIDATLEKGNRMIRKYSDISLNFAIVTFVNEELKVNFITITIKNLKL